LNPRRDTGEGHGFRRAAPGLEVDEGFRVCLRRCEFFRVTALTLCIRARLLIGP
jgi:hypothetical protein